MAVATLTSKGQVTIPKSVRDALQLQSGCKIEISVTSEGEALIRPISRTSEEVFGRLRDRNKSTRQVVSIEEMDEAIAERMKRDFQ
ncbi:MAG: AbrB/MazE/SpoVT family DNA-binding domain-containing protein [Verrucomicrobiales bacterium]|nr:AbrB/MazE/SpoVT family DNA-binding domain-containing protein [Verrucomicrobiales bacterium]